MMISKDALIDLVLEWHLLEQEGRHPKADKVWKHIQDHLNIIYVQANALQGVTIEDIKEALQLKPDIADDLLKFRQGELETFDADDVAKELGLDMEAMRDE